jgi:deoxyribose-phosphate aldolase
MNLASYIDHTILKPTTLVTDVEQLCTEAIENNFTTVCVPPLFVKKAKTLCANTNIKIATVIGFPFGYSAVEAKLAEILLAIVDGADELDMVINIAALKNNDWQYLAYELNHVMTVVRNKQKTIKIIIESGILTDEEIIKCCDLYGIAGVDFISTSTGFAENGASIHAVKLMRKHLAEAIKIKANGGIRTFALSQKLIEAGANRIGSSNSMVIVAESKW